MHDAEIREILNEIKDDLKKDLADLSETVSYLAEELEGHKSKTASEIADFKSSVELKLVHLQSSFQSILDSPNPEHVSNAMLTKLLPNNMEDDIQQSPKMYQRIASLEQKISSMINSSFDTRMSSLDEKITDSLSDVKAKLDGFSNATRIVCDKETDSLEVDKRQVSSTDISAELLEMKQDLTEKIGYNCGGTGGWRRAVYLDMRDPNTECPSGWKLTSYPRRTCGKSSSRPVSCHSAFFPVSEGPYSQVCGRIRAYQWGRPLAFYGYRRQATIDSAYFAGVAVMHGNPRQHIWTFVAGASENNTEDTVRNCPCDTSGDVKIPSFVREDYFCESGYVYPGYRDRIGWYYSFHPDDILWDGEDCHSTSSCCSLHNPPYFTKLLSQTTSDDLELRMCVHSNENIAVELVELYVKQDYVQVQLQEMYSELKESLQHQTKYLNNLHTYQCGSTGGWRRAVHLDMTDPITNCPPSWQLTVYSNNIRTCGKSGVHFTGSKTCDSVFFPIDGAPYSQVCGRIRAYQWGLPRAFLGYHQGENTVDKAYFSGVAVVHGNPRQHIWTFAAGVCQNRTGYRRDFCPCDSGNFYRSSPPFVGDDYFCESGYTCGSNKHPFSNIFRLYSDDVLWDGKDCPSTSTCCSLHNPPYFTKTLNQTTTDDLELRLCLRDNIGYENIAVELVELYVK